MTRNIFGWSYPPGCSGPPEDPPQSVLAEEVWVLLEDAHVDQATIERIDAAIYELEAKAEAPCPVCERKAIEDEMRFWHMEQEEQRIEQEESWQQETRTD